MSIVSLSKNKVALVAAVVTAPLLVLSAARTFGNNADESQVAGNQITREAEADELDAAALDGSMDSSQPGLPATAGDAPADSTPFDSAPAAVNTNDATPSTAQARNARSGNPSQGGGKGSVQRGVFEMTGSVAGLYPGAREPLSLKLENDESFAVLVTSMGMSVTATSDPACAAANFVGGEFTDNPQTTSDDIVIPRSGERTVTLYVGMVADPPDSCQDVTWSLSYTGKAVKA